MGNLDGIERRAKLDSLVSYLMDGACALPIKDGFYCGQVISEYERLFDILDQKFQIKSRESEDICNILADVYATCQSAYFEAGLAAGFHICKNLSSEYLAMEENDEIKFMIRELAKKIEGIK